MLTLASLDGEEQKEKEWKPYIDREYFSLVNYIQMMETTLISHFILYPVKNDLL